MVQAIIAASLVAQEYDWAAPVAPLAPPQTHLLTNPAKYLPARTHPRVARIRSRENPTRSPPPPPLAVPLPSEIILECKITICRCFRRLIFRHHELPFVEKLAIIALLSAMLDREDPKIIEELVGGKALKLETKTTKQLP